ncbi:MAG: YfbK domain-containing protein [Acidobacteriota bacterium]
MSSRLRVCAVGLLGWVLVAAVPYGQTGAPTSQASGVVVEGTVVDATRSPLPGVTVTLEQARAVVAKAVTDPSGKFRFTGIQPGKYVVVAVLQGFTTLRQDLTVNTSSGTVQVPLTMQVAGVAESIVVAGKALEATRVATTTASAKGYGQGGGGGRGAGAQYLPGRYAPFANTESYARIEKNQFKLTTDDPLSTFAADVDTASYANVRRFLTNGELPPVDAVRVEELVNYFRFSYPEPDSRRPVSVTTEVGDCPWARSHKLLLVGVRAKAIDQREVSGRNIVLLIDVSGSMSSPDKLPLVKTALRMFVDTLRDDDRISIVVYAGASGLALPTTPGRARQRIHEAIESLEAGGSTNGGQGLVLAYNVAQQSFIKGGINRVILATDGDFNVGVVGQGDLLRLIEEKKQSGIFLSVLGVGTGNLKDSTMEMLADRGNGHYAYLDSLQEARRVLVREGGATLETVAKDVKFQVEFNPGAIRAWKLIGYENRLLQHQDFNDDKKDGGELGAGHTVTVLYEIVPAGVPLPADVAGTDGRATVDPLKYQTERKPAGVNASELATVKIRYKLPAESESTLMQQAVRSSRGSAHLPFAAVVAEFGLLLRDEKATREQWAGLIQHVRAFKSSSESLSADQDGFTELVELAAGLKRLGRPER